MAQNKNIETRSPDFKGDGVAVWMNTDKNGHKYLAVKLLGGLTVRAFPLSIEAAGEAASNNSFISADEYEVRYE